MCSPLAVSPRQTPESTAARVAPSPGIVTPTGKPKTKVASVVEPAMPVEEPKTNVASKTQNHSEIPKSSHPHRRYFVLPQYSVVFFCWASPRPPRVGLVCTLKLYSETSYPFLGSSNHSKSIETIDTIPSDILARLTR